MWIISGRWFEADFKLTSMQFRCACNTCNFCVCAIVLKWFDVNQSWTIRLNEEVRGWNFNLICSSDVPRPSYHPLLIACSMQNGVCIFTCICVLSVFEYTSVFLVNITKLKDLLFDPCSKLGYIYLMTKMGGTAITSKNKHNQTQRLIGGNYAK